MDDRAFQAQVIDLLVKILAQLTAIAASLARPGRK